MQNKSTIMVLFAIVGVTSGLVGYTFSASDQVTPTTSLATSSLAGHLTVEARDSDGNLQVYRQTDNVITNTGENCALRHLFSSGSITDTGTSACIGALTTPFTTIQLGTGTTFEQETNTALGTPITDAGLDISAAPVTTLTWSNATGVDSTDAARVTITKIYSPTATRTVTEAGLFNSTDPNTNGIFARKTFAGVTVNNGDTLTVAWTIYIGNATAAGIGNPNN